MLQKRHASKTVDLSTFSTNVNIIADPVSERRRQIALQVIIQLLSSARLLLALRKHLLRKSFYFTLQTFYDFTTSAVSAWKFAQIIS